MRAGEVWNGRVAMVALLADYLIEKLTDKPIIDTYTLPFL